MLFELSNQKSWCLGCLLASFLLLIAEGAHLTTKFAHGVAGHPSVELFSSLVAQISNEDIGGLTAGIEALSVVVRNAAALEGDDLPGAVRMCLGDGSPEGHVDADVALVTDGKGTLLLGVTIAEIN